MIRFFDNLEVTREDQEQKQAAFSAMEANVEELTTELILRRRQLASVPHPAAGAFTSGGRFRKSLIEAAVITLCKMLPKFDNSAVCFL